MSRQLTLFQCSHSQSSSSKHGDHQQDYEENEVLFDSEALELSEFSDKSDDDQQMYGSDDNELGCTSIESPLSSSVLQLEAGDLDLMEQPEIESSDSAGKLFLSQVSLSSQLYYTFR